MNYQLYKFYYKYRIFELFQGKPQYLKYKEIQKVINNELNDVVLYMKESDYGKKPFLNIEHVICQKYAKRRKEWEPIKFDLHNLYLSNEKENTYRNDKKLCIHSSKHTKDIYPINKRDYPYIVSTISYFSIQYPTLFYKHFDEFVSNEDNWKKMINETIKQLVENDKLNQNLIYRNKKIGQIQFNENPFIKYPILYYYVFNCGNEYKKNLWKLTFYNIYLRFIFIH